MSQDKDFTPPNPLNTAVLFLVFNRLDTTRQVFESIRKAKPPRLYIAADGPRETKKGESEKVQQVRNFVMSNIDWPCEIKTLFRDKNIGCKYAVSGAINWFFEQEEQGIILEDDCLPSQSFFWFCENLLNFYKNDTRILHIGGTNPVDSSSLSDEYYYSNYNRIWGWATWRRSWSFYDLNMEDWPHIRSLGVLESFLGKKEAKKYATIFDDVYAGKIDTWDYQWFFCRLLQGKSIIPKVNLVSNIGFGADATHTTDLEHKLSKLPTGEVGFPLKHNRLFLVDQNRDKKWRNFSNNEQGILKRLWRKCSLVK